MLSSYLNLRLPLGLFPFIFNFITTLGVIFFSPHDMAKPSNHKLSNCPVILYTHKIYSFSIIGSIVHAFNDVSRSSAHCPYLQVGSTLIVRQESSHSPMLLLSTNCIVESSLHDYVAAQKTFNTFIGPTGLSYD